MLTFYFPYMELVTGNCLLIFRNAFGSNEALEDGFLGDLAVFEGVLDPGNKAHEADILFALVYGKLIEKIIDEIVVDLGSVV